MSQRPATGQERSTVYVAAPAHKYVASTLTPSGNGGHQGDRNADLAERCHNLQIENRELKIARNQQEQTLKELNAQFARLKRDLKYKSGEEQAPVSARGADEKPDKLKAKLLKVTKERDDALKLVEELKSKLARFRSYDRAGGAPTTTSSTTPRTGGASRAGPHGHIAAAAEVNVLDLLDPNRIAQHGRPASASTPAAAAKMVPLATHEATVRDFEQRARRDSQRIRDLMEERDALRRQTDVARQARSAAASTLDRSQLDADRVAALETEATQLRQRYATVAAQLETAQLDRDRHAADLRAAHEQLRSLRESQSGHHQPQRDFSPSQSQHRIDMPRRFESTADHHQHSSPHGGTQQHRFATTSDGAATAYPEQHQHHQHQQPPLPTPASMAQSQRVFDEYAGELHPDVRDAISTQNAQLVSLAYRFEQSRSHAVALQQETERLVGELGALQTNLATEKKRIFALESEKATLTLRAGRTEEVERMLTMKNEELIVCQQQLLEMADKMSTYVREAESTAKLEHASRLHDAHARADAAEREQRTKEREVYALKLELQEAARHRDAAREDLADARTRLEAAVKEKSELQQRLVNSAASLPVQPGAVEESIARMMADRRPDHEGEGGDGDSSSAATSRWELSTLREAAAATARDLEFAEQRADAFERECQQRSKDLRMCTQQRDELLGENLRLRQEITGIKTSLESRERAVIDEASGMLASVSVAVEHIQCEPAALVAKPDEDPAAVGAAPALFVSLDGVSAFEPAVSDVVHAADAECDLRFVFGGLSIGGDAPATLRTDAAQLQLHRSTGLTSHVVAAASLPMLHVLAKVLEGGGEAVLRTALYDGAGTPVAQLTLRVRVSHVALALAVVRPDMQRDAEALSAAKPDDSGTTKYALASLGKGDVAERINAWLFAFRGVIAIRIAVRRCRGLAKNASGVDPSPYVFYTVDGEGAAFVTDTVVHTAGRQLTCDPDFDAEPVDHPVRVGSQLHDYVRGATITFAVFDTRSEDAESNLGTTTLPLASLAESPQSTVVREAALHPSGTIEVAVSWVRC